MKHKLRILGVPHRVRIRRSDTPEQTLQSGSGSSFNFKISTRFGLTERERQVMEHLARGLLYKEIADAMNVSYAAVHKLQHKIFLKLDVRNRTEAVVKWRDHQS